MKLAKFPDMILGNRKIVFFLFVVNLAGFFAGIYFYREQLATSNPLLWIVIIDSPLSVLLFSIVCLLIYFRKKIPSLLSFLASAYLIKYGVWTMITLVLYRENYVIFQDQIIGILDFLLHFGMIIEGVILVPRILPKFRDFAAILFVLFFNDYFDYFMGTVTRIPGTYIDFLMIESFAATFVIASSIFICQRVYQNKQS